VSPGLGGGVSAARVRRKLRDLRSARRYRAATARHAARLPVLGEGDRRIVEALRREKVFVTSLDELGLPHTDAFWEAAHALARELPPRDAHSDFLFRSLPERTVARRALFDWGLQDRLLDIVESRIGLPPGLRELNVRRNYADGSERGTRLWHVDGEDHSVVRVIVYLQDVGEDGGPVEYVSAGALGGAVSSLVWLGTLRDRSLRRLVPASWIRTCTGPAGTVLFVVTSQVLHHGRIPVGSDRDAVFYTFNSRRPRRETGRPTWPLESVRGLAEKLPPRQRACLLWESD
jgi:hypothetical protein